MKKLKFDAVKQEYTLKLTPTEFQVIDSLLANVQLGQSNNRFVKATENLCELFEEEVPLVSTHFFRDQIVINSISLGSDANDFHLELYEGVAYAK